ncbi:MAG: alpha/beta hydrolase [Planctomycetales bacterium]|nr:alpha/beta hydrolase [Planctomycetales bacterium]
MTSEDDTKTLLLSCIEKGDPNNPILFFIHGWPDSAQIWEAQLDYFSSRYRCIAVMLPGFDERCNSQLSFDRLEAKLRATLINKLSTNPHRKVTLVCHDWGALFGYLLERELSDQIDRLVTIDVGGNFHMENWRQRIGITFYQWWLIKAYIIGKVFPAIGDWLTRIMVTLLKAPKRSTPAHSEMNYLYWYFWWSLLTTGRFAAIDGNYKPSKPLLFLFGKNKPFHLHTAEWIELVNSSPKSRTLGIDSDHWVMVREPDQTNAVIDEFLATAVEESLRPKSSS